MLKLIEFSHNYLPSRVKLLAKNIRRGIRVIFLLPISKSRRTPAPVGQRLCRSAQVRFARMCNNREGVSPVPPLPLANPLGGHLQNKIKHPLDLTWTKGGNHE
jgi:hypothetical protein